MCSKFSFNFVYHKYNKGISIAWELQSITMEYQGYYDHLFIHSFISSNIYRTCNKWDIVSVTKDATVKT